MMKQRSLANKKNTTPVISNCVDIKKLESDVKKDIYARERLATGLEGLIDSEQDKMVAQQESLSCLRDLDIQFENPNAEKKLLPGLEKVYEEWKTFSINYDPTITDNYISSMASIVEELNSPIKKNQNLDKIPEYKACLQELEEICKEDTDKRPSTLTKKTSTRSVKDQKVQDDQIKDCKEKLLKIEDSLIKQVVNYESSRQRSYTKCLINYLINNIEYHGQAVDSLSRIMDHFVQSEQEVQVQEPKMNRFLKIKC